MLQGWLFLHGSFWTKERAKALLTSIPQASKNLEKMKQGYKFKFIRDECLFWICSLNWLSSLLG